MTKKIKEYMKELAGYTDQYVALSSKNPHKIIIAGKTIKLLEEKLEKLNISDIEIMYVPPIDKALSPVCQ